MGHRRLLTWMVKPAALFAFAAAVLAVNGLVFFHMQWPPLAWKNIHWATDDYGKFLLIDAALFAAIALIYVALEGRTLVQKNTAVGLIHFGLSLTAVFAQVFLDYWLDVTYKPSGGFLGALGAFGASFAALVWAAYIFIAAQLIFLFNLAYLLFKRFRQSGAHTLTLSQS